jgi:hypothetical protein
MKNGAVKIENGIPIPEGHRGRNPSAVGIAMRSMKKGDSIKTAQTNGAARMMAHKILGAGNYAVRPDGEGARIWRIK